MGLVGVRSTDLDRFEVEARPGGLVRPYGRLIRDPVHACPTHPDRGDVADLATADTNLIGFRPLTWTRDGVACGDGVLLEGWADEEPSGALARFYVRLTQLQTEANGRYRCPG
jgi:hypothetical protein